MNEKLKGGLFCLVSTALLSVAVVGIRYLAMQEVSPPILASGRELIAGLALLAVGLGVQKSQSVDATLNFESLSLMSLGVYLSKAAATMFNILALALVSAPVFYMFAKLDVVWTYFIMMGLAGGVLGKDSFVGIIVTLLGVGVTVGGLGGGALPSIGIVFAVLAGLSMALFTVLLDFHPVQAQSWLDTLFLTASYLLGSGLVNAALLPFFGGNYPTPFGWTLLVGTSLLGFSAAYLLYSIGLRYADGLTGITTISMLIPFTMISEGLILGTQLPPRVYGGGTFFVIAVVLVGSDMAQFEDAFEDVRDEQENRAKKESAEES